MRAATAYETYLRRARDYYEIKKQDQPEWINKADNYYHELFFFVRSLSRMCSDCAIPKATMEQLANLKEVPNGLPTELAEAGMKVNTILNAMYNTLMASRDVYFINEWTLSRRGRRAMREFVNQATLAIKFEVTENEFANVPFRILFENKRYQAEYELVVSFAHSIIYVANGGLVEQFIFTERFLDKAIALAQKENFKPVNRKNRTENIDDLKYQDFKTLLAGVNCDYYVLELSSETKDNVFMNILKLVWDEYGHDLKEKNLVLPWFYTLGFMN